MNATRIFFLTIICCSCLHPFLRAQPPEKQRAMEALRSLSDRYRNYKNLSFNISYRYSSEDKPGIYLDSLKGAFSMSGSRYRYVIDSTEFMGSAALTLVVYKQDKVLFLSKTPAVPQAGNPIALLDSIVLKNDSVNCRLTETKELQKIQLSFTAGSAMKQLEYTIDRKSGLVSRITQVVPAKQLYDPSVSSLVEGNASYAIVEILFMNYREGGFEERELDLGRYIKKEGAQYVPVAPYESYKIFLATPDL